MKVILLPFFAYLGVAAAMTCNEGEIFCTMSPKCIPRRYICDNDNDCGDGADESPDLCRVWGDDDCSKNQVRCTRLNESSCVDIPRYCSFDDPPCEGSLDRRVCSMLDSGEIQDLDNFITTNRVVAIENINTTDGQANRFRNLIPVTLRHPGCPPMYTLVGGQCISVFYIGSMTWAEGRSFCEILGGDLMTFRNESQYAVVAQHLQRYGLTSDFWVGGRIEDVDHGWTWIDGSPMGLGSPIWATRYSNNCVERNVTVAASQEVCYRYRQAPHAQNNGQCAGLTFEHFFYMSDEDCLKKMSPLCVYVKEDE